MRVLGAGHRAEAPPHRQVKSLVAFDLMLYNLGRDVISKTVAMT